MCGLACALLHLQAVLAVPAGDIQIPVLPAQTGQLLVVAAQGGNAVHRSQIGDGHGGVAVRTTGGAVIGLPIVCYKTHWLRMIVIPVLSEERVAKVFGAVLDVSDLYEDEYDKKRKRETAIKLISHINKLRNGNRYSNDIDSGYIIITNTKVILLISKEQADIIKEKEGIDNVCNFAVSLDRITSLLWYKLGKGFAGKSFPSSVDAALKARIVLSSSIAKNAEKAFTELKKQYEDGTITEDQVAARIIALRNKPRLPEDLQGDDIAEIMDFSPEYLSRYEEQFKNAQKALKEKDELVKTIRADATKRIAEMDATIASQGSAIKEKDDENAKLRETIEAYKRRDDEVAKKKESRKRKRKFRLSIAFRLFLIVFITGIIIALKRLFSFDTTQRTRQCFRHLHLWRWRGCPWLIVSPKMR